MPWWHRSAAHSTQITQIAQSTRELRCCDDSQNPDTIKTSLRLCGAVWAISTCTLVNPRSESGTCHKLSQPPISCHGVSCLEEQQSLSSGFHCHGTWCDRSGCCWCACRPIASLSSVKSCQVSSSPRHRLVSWLIYELMMPCSRLCSVFLVNYHHSFMQSSSGIRAV